MNNAPLFFLGRKSFLREQMLFAYASLLTLTLTSQRAALLCTVRYMRMEITADQRNAALCCLALTKNSIKKMYFRPIALHYDYVIHLGDVSHVIRFVRR